MDCAIGNKNNRILFLGIGSVTRLDTWLTAQSAHLIFRMSLNMICISFIKIHWNTFKYGQFIKIEYISNWKRNPKAKRIRELIMVFNVKKKQSADYKCRYLFCPLKSNIHWYQSITTLSISSFLFNLSLCISNIRTCSLYSHC